MECFHSCCEECLDQELKKKSAQNRSCNVPSVTCPLCKTDSSSDYIINNHFLIEMLDLLQKDESPSGSASSGSAEEFVKCANDCEIDGVFTPAKFYCVECSQLICEVCQEAHKRLKITKDHTIKSKDEMDIKSDKEQVKELKCNNHPNEVLSIYCETCDTLTCRDCQLGDHRSHTYKMANEMAKDTRDHLQNLLQEISYKKVLLSSAMKVIDDRQALIADKKTELSKEIHDLVAKLASAVSSRGKQLMTRLNQVCEQKLQVLSEKKDALSLLSGHTDHCINFVQHSLDNGSDGAVLYSKKTLSRHLNKVKCQRADIPNPEIPVRVQLFLSNVPELENGELTVVTTKTSLKLANLTKTSIILVISRIGTILVDGKVYPPTAGGPSGSATPPAANHQPNPLHQMAQQVDNRAQQLPRQRQSPNVTPPLRPINHQQPGPNSGYNNSNSSLFAGGPSAGFPPPGLRNFPGDSRFPMHMGPPQPHVSSSTHPTMGNGKQNLSLESLKLSHLSL